MEYLAECFMQNIRLIILLFTFNSLPISAENFTDVVEEVTSSVVAIGLYTPLENNGNQILGTGFVVADGKHAITNYHVVSKILDPLMVQHFVVITGYGQNIKAYKAKLIEKDPLHDLALLEFEGNLPALALAPNSLLKPGTDIAFTGFPIGALLGLYPATHRGYISAITPDAIPARNSNELTTNMMQRLDNTSLIYQLDAIAYPGNSGSPVYNTSTGEVIGVINKALVKDTKESALSSPTGISYAIPVTYVSALLIRSR